MPSSANIPLLGPTALPATMSVPRQRAKGGPAWQYHSRSDHHSKVSCLLMQLDLMLISPWLRQDVANAKVACGINHVMQDHASHRKKAFDLVLHRPDVLDRSLPATTFKRLLKEYGVILTPDQAALVAELPEVPIRRVPANGVYVAWEAKAAMTEFGKARPRLFDELNSSHLTIHGDTQAAIAAGLVLVNTADTFISPIRNPGGPLQMPAELEVTRHRQPADFLSVVKKVDELPRTPGINGFDALGIVAIECHNDNSEVRLITHEELRPALDGSDYDMLANFDYGRMIGRVAHLYETRFHRS
jgi:hypothetical protein